jgi:hypothetical protein
MSVEYTKGRLTDVHSIKDYALAGSATLTVVSRETGKRFTYRVRRARAREGNPIWFVSVMVGPDNERNYRYIGNIRSDVTFDVGRKCWLPTSDPRVRGFAWLWQRIRIEDPTVLFKIEVWHEGRCGRCGRKLTVPESIESGFGPECSGRRTREQEARSAQRKLPLESGEVHL